MYSSFSSLGAGCRERLRPFEPIKFGSSYIESKLKEAKDRAVAFLDLGETAPEKTRSAEALKKLQTYMKEMMKNVSGNLKDEVRAVIEGSRPKDHVERGDAGSLISVFQYLENKTANILNQDLLDLHEVIQESFIIFAEEIKEGLRKRAKKLIFPVAVDFDKQFALYRCPPSKGTGRPIKNQEGLKVNILPRARV